jgi:hypothetical protein
MVQPATPIQPNGDNPRRIHKSYMDKFGTNPMKASFDNCFIRTRLGVDPVTGQTTTVWQEQIARELQILESVGELAFFFRYDITPNENINNGQRCPLCWDARRHQARQNCPRCNGSGIITNDPNITRVQGYEWIRNPDTPSGMFYTHLNFAPQKMESRDIGFYATHAPRYWTVPIRNSQGNVVNFLQNRDVMIRFIFDPNTNTPIRELERLVMTDMNYSVGPNNQLLHMEWQTEKANPGIDFKTFGLPNFLN